MKTTIHYSESYDEYRVAVGKSTYYTGDQQDAFDTLDKMRKESGLPPITVKVKGANADLEDNW